MTGFQVADRREIKETSTRMYSLSLVERLLIEPNWAGNAHKRAKQSPQMNDTNLSIPLVNKQG